MVKNCLIINMDERPELWKNLEDFRQAWTNTGKTWERIVGINYNKKKNVLNNFIINGRINVMMGGFRNNKTALLGELGCYMGHYNAWKYVVDNKLESCLIMEDGVTIINSKFKELTIPNTLDILYVNAEMEQHSENQVYGYGLQGYIVTYEGAKKLMKECHVLQLPIDLQIVHLCKIRALKASALTNPYVMRNDKRVSSIDGSIIKETNSRIEKQTMLRDHQNQSSIIQRILINLIRKNINLDEYVECDDNYVRST